MEKRDDAYSIDIKNIANSLRGKFQTLYPLSQECCIYRVRQTARCLNPSDYTPQEVGIGPLHHGKEELKAMEEYKIRYLQYFLQRTKVSLEDFLSLIKDKEMKLRNCYAETIELESYEFVRIILVDAVFLIEYFLRGYKPNLRTVDDRIFGKPNLMCTAIDLLLMENQLPLFIFNDLFNLAKTATDGDHYEGLSFVKISSWFQKDILICFPTEENLLEIKFSEAKHFLDFVRLCLQPSPRPSQTELEVQNIPSATELHRAGVKFMKSSSKNLLDMEFIKEKGILKIPCFMVTEDTKCLYSNILAFEDVHCYTNYFSDYVIIMGCLINTPKDAELLVENGIIQRVGESEKLTTLFQNLVKDSYLNPTTFHYSDLVKDLNVYYRSPWHR